MNNYSQDEFNSLVSQVKDLSNKADSMQDSIALIDSKVEKTKYITKLLDVNVSYPAENDVLVYDKTGKWKNAQYDEIGLNQGEGGESNIYVIGIGDETAPTNENVYSAARTIEDWVSSKKDDTIEGNITFADGKNIYINGIQSKNASAGDLGSGLIYKIKDKGVSYLELDELMVRKTATFNTLEIKKITAVGGNLIVSPASNNIIRVEESSQNYEGSVLKVWRCFFRDEVASEGKPTETIRTEFLAGDLAKIQLFNISEGVQENVKNRFYWGKVLGVGKNYIDLSLTDKDPSSNTQPKAGDALVMYGHKGNTAEDIKRLNAIAISSYGDNAPSIQMYQGLNDYTVENKAIIDMGYDTTEAQQLAYFNVFGRMYVGTKDKITSYIKYDPTANENKGLLTVKASILVKDPDNDGDTTLIEGGYIRTNLLKADEIIANVGVIKNELLVGDHFRVNKEGKMTASEASISGLINATSGTFNNVTISSGTIGGFKIDSSTLIAGDRNAGEYMLLSKPEIRFNTSTMDYDKTVSLGVSGSGVLPGTTGLTVPFGVYSKAKNNFVENIGLYINCEGSRRLANTGTGNLTGNIALWVQNGITKGLRLPVEYLDVSSGGKKYINLDYTVHIIKSTTTDKNDVYLPTTGVKEGDFAIIIKSGPKDVWIWEENSKIYRGKFTDRLFLNWSNIAILTYTESFGKEGVPGVWFAGDSVQN